MVVSQVDLDWGRTESDRISVGQVEIVDIDLFSSGRWQSWPAGFLKDSPTDRDFEDPFKGV